MIMIAVNVGALGLIKKGMDQNLGTWDSWRDKINELQKIILLVLGMARILRRFLSILGLPLPAQNLKTLLSVERLCYIRKILKLRLNWPDVRQKQQKQANTICHRRTFHSQDLIPHQEWPEWKLKYYQKTKSIPKRATWSDIQRKKAFIILPSIETLLRKVWPLLKRLDKGKIHKFTSKIMWLLESDVSFLIEAKN